MVWVPWNGSWVVYVGYALLRDCGVHEHVCCQVVRTDSVHHSLSHNPFPVSTHVFGGKPPSCYVQVRVLAERTSMYASCRNLH